MSKRLEEIGSAIEKLEQLKHDPTFTEKMYAIEANVEFLNAIKTVPRYINWLFTKASKLDSAKLLELTDFPVPEWDIKMHKRLIEIERRDRPGLVKPIVDAVVDEVSKADRDMVVADLGAGGMEVDRQVAIRVAKSSSVHKLTIVAFDKSATTREIARENLTDISAEVEIVETGILTQTELESLRKKAAKKVLIIMATNDIFDLGNSFPEKYFDIAYHSLFKHHLDKMEQEKFDGVIVGLTNKIVEYDGYRDMIIIPLQTLVGWNYPHFLNAELFSNFRFETKNNVKKYAEEKDRLSFYPSTGHYLLLNTIKN